ncbi:hypothetical protein [Algoriphagus yeomjeoni]|uniref:hypothetical protein n=1 Tax=Algoriphagus yeomjeoni TaxID=291403 RepID=UPI001314BA88|nr:hypothetical protein [Algoriphagus yeomjeoni]
MEISLEGINDNSVNIFTKACQLFCQCDTKTAENSDGTSIEEREKYSIEKNLKTYNHGKNHRH